MNKITVGPINKGLKTDRLPFVIDNDSFPILVNAYQWRGRIKRKRGTSQLNRLTRFFDSTSTAFSSISSFNLVAGAGNLFTSFNIPGNPEIVENSIILTDNTNGRVYQESPPFQLSGVPTGTGTLNRITGDITLTNGASHSISASFLYYPNMPVLGLEDVNLNPSLPTQTLAFDPTYAYNIATSFPYDILSVSFYKNLQSGTHPGYIQKNIYTPSTWNGLTYQQYWSVNYQGAFWVTNGVTTPFTPSNIGMQFAPASAIAYVSNTATTISVTISGSPLVVGDFVFFNEWSGANAINLNFQTGYVTTAAAPNYTITLPFANLGAGPYVPGIIQYLTNRSDITKDCIRWYDGTMTNGNPNPPTFINSKGWVNFMPPLSRADFSIADLPAHQYYLVGARLIQAFKDRLLFIGAVVQSSQVGANPIYLQDTIVYSQNGTPYYTASFIGDPTLATTIYTPVLVPDNQTATASAWWGDQTGFGGNISEGSNSSIITVASNEDVLILGFSEFQSRLVYTGNDLVPFNFYSIDSELPSNSTFSVINMGKGSFTRGDRGFVLTTQREANRVDLDILDQEFQIDVERNGAERFTAIRDFSNEWIYFTYRSDATDYIFPSQTLQYNYRDDTWAIFNESYTHYGQFRKDTGYIWSNLPYDSWDAWTVPWNSVEGNILKPEVIAGNQQGFVMVRDNGTNEGRSLYVKDYLVNLSGYIVTVVSPGHCLNEGDYILLKGPSLQPGNRVSQVAGPVTEDTFSINPPILRSSVYKGGGTIIRFYNPFIQTKQFPTYWSMGRKTRIGVQQYLLTATASAQIQLLIFLSQNSSYGYNSGNLVPNLSVLNSSLIYSTVLFTCVESTNLGLTPANINLQMISDKMGTTGQEQIWHRINTSLIGDTVQIGFTMSDTQMRDSTLTNQFAEIELHGFILETYPSQLLS